MRITHIFKSFLLFLVSINCYRVDISKISHIAMNSLSKEQEDQLRAFGEPLLDVELVKRTIQQWTNPLPLDYLTRPLIVVGPSAVGKGYFI